MQCHYKLILILIADNELQRKFDNVNKGTIYHLDFAAMAHDVTSIVNGYLNPQHANRVACQWGGALIRLALLLVQHAMLIVIHPNGKKTQECVMIEGSSLGGQGVGLKYNTRVVYFPVLKWQELDDLLNDEFFPFYEGYFIEYVCDLLKEGKVMPSTKICHDSCMSYGELLLFVHEAQSGSMEEYILKVVLGLCRMLPYSRRPCGIITSDHDITWVQIKLDHAKQRIVYKTQQMLSI